VSCEPLPALVLVGGVGSRLRAVSGDLPKPMVPIAGRPFLEYLLRFLRGQDVRRVVLCVGYAADRIRSYFGAGERVGLELDYSEEQELLGTGGALKLGAARAAGSTLLALNGDSFVNFNVQEMLRTHRARGAAVTVALTRVPDAARFGAVDWDGRSGLIRAFGEKARGGPGLINAGVYLVEREVIEAIPEGVVSLEHRVLPDLAGKRAYGVVAEGPFVDIGLPEEYRRLLADPGELLRTVPGVAA
jgi:D-glycero-alpha-D-manno-heptose 1-phosphate guanylyltransferase